MQIGLGGSFGFGSAGFGFAFDTYGNVDVYGYLGGGVTVGAGGGVGLSIQASNAPTICNLKGPFNNVSAQGGVGMGGSVDYFNGMSGNLPVYGGGVTIGGGGGASVSGGITNTWLFSH